MELVLSKITVKIKELTVSEFRNWWQSVSKRDASKVAENDLFFNYFYGLYPADIKIFVDGEIELDNLLQSDVEKLVESIKEQNPNFLKISRVQNDTMAQLTALTNR